jgi:hypothetical protein
MEGFYGLFALVALVGVPVFFLWGKRAFDRAAIESLQRIYADAERRARTRTSAPVVSFKYHTYSGILVYVAQTEHQFTLPRPIADDTLDALLKHTLKFGFFAYGALLIPILAYANYLGQKRAIAKQAATPRPSVARNR